MGQVSHALKNMGKESGVVEVDMTAYMNGEMKE
jgi:hypothetical protein